MPQPPSLGEAQHMASSGLLPLALWGDKEKQSPFEGLFGPCLAMRRVYCLFFCLNFQLFLEGAPVGCLVHTLLFALSGPYTMLIKLHPADNARGALVITPKLGQLLKKEHVP